VFVTRCCAVNIVRLIVHTGVAINASKTARLIIRTPWVAANCSGPVIKAIQLGVTILEAQSYFRNKRASLKGRLMPWLIPEWHSAIMRQRISLMLNTVKFYPHQIGFLNQWF